MSKVTLRALRREIPSWDWRAERCGMGWRYIGEQAWARVTVQAFSVICGPSEDDCCTQWRVLEGTESETFAEFWLKWAEAKP